MQSLLTHVNPDSSMVAVLMQATTKPRGGERHDDEGEGYQSGSISSCIDAMAR